MSGFSVKKPYTVLVGVILVVVLGIVSFTKTTTDLLPSISLPYVIVMTTYPGASPETVEAVVTQPVEAGMATVSNIESIQSVSSENYSMVILEFSQSTNMDSISLEIREKLDQIKGYWDDSVGNPMIMKLNPDMLPVMIAAVGVDGMDDAEISAYVKDSVMPELESIEGVASASASGLLEKSVNVVIRKEKVDALNEKIRSVIDEKMLEAEQEIADGKQKLEDGRNELADGEKKINDSQKELLDGEKKLEDGKQELSNKQEETLTTLSQTKLQLLSAKTGLESTKTTMTVVKTLAEGFQKKLEELRKKAQEGNDVLDELLLLRDLIVQNEWIQQLAAENPELKAILDKLASIKADDLNAMVQLIDAINEAINSLMKTVNSTLSTLEQNGKLVDEGLAAVEKGALTAAIEFANATAKIAISEYQMELAKTQLEQAKEQMQTGKDQMDDAYEQLLEGEKQLEDARQDAYDQADMANVLSVETIEGLLMAQNFSMPAGYVTEDGVDFLIRVGDKPESVEELRSMPLIDLHMDGIDPILLEDVADVFYTDNSDAIYTNVNGSAGVILTLQKQTGYSTGEVSDKLVAKFKKLMEENEALSIITLMDQGIYIDLVMNSIFSNILFGGLLSILILLLFLKDWRPTLIVALSIPISLVTAIVCMYFAGVTLNVISLSGLALGIGMLVDNSIVVIENIYRLRKEGANVKEAAVEGAREVAGAIVASTLTTVCVFLPIVFTEGITRQLFVDMGLTIAFSLFASLLIALTVVPAMASGLLIKTKEQKNGRFFEGLLRVYGKVISKALSLKPLVFLLALVLLVGSCLAALSNGTAFMSDMDSTQMTVNVRLDDSALLSDTARVTDEVVEILCSIEDITDVGAMANSSNSMMGLGGSVSNNSTTIYVVTDEKKKRTNEEIAREIREKTAEVEAEVTVDTSSMDMSALGGSGVTIQVRGRDLDTLKEIASEVAGILEGVPGTKDVSDGLAESGTEFRIHVKKEEAVKYGLTVAQVFSQIMTRVAEASSSTVLSGNDQDYSVYVSNDQDSTLTREMLKQIQVEGQDENREKIMIALEDIADFEDARSLDSINRADQNRYVAVSAGIAEGHNVGIVARDIEKALADYEVPAGYRLVYSGENETINEAMGQLLLMLLLAVIFMYLIMVAQFQSLLSPFIILFTVPLAFTGGFMGLFVSGSEISVVALIGFVMLSGIIVNNGIVLIDHMNQLRAAGMKKKEAIVQAGITRLRPVLMTALTTILALSTMVFSNDMGSEMGKPMAIVTIGGLLYGTLLTLIVIPCVYDLFIKECIVE